MNILLTQYTGEKQGSKVAGDGMRQNLLYNKEQSWLCKFKSSPNPSRVEYIEYFVCMY